MKRTASLLLPGLILLGASSVAFAGSALQLKHDGGTLALPQASPWGKLAWTDRCGSSSRMCADAVASGGVQLYLLGGQVSPEEARSEFACEPGATRDAKAQVCIRTEGEAVTVMRRMGAIAVAISVQPAGTVSQSALKDWISGLSWQGGAR